MMVMAPFIFLLVFCLSTVSTFVFGRRGEVIPLNPYVYIGEELQLTCVLTEDTREDSSRMFFSFKNSRLDHNTIPINTRNIELRKVIQSPADEGLYVCKMRTHQEISAVISSQFVTVEYPLPNLSHLDMQCTVHNWEMMVCTWDLGLTFLHPENISTQLAWTVQNQVQAFCPYMKDNSCTWKLDEDNTSFFRNLKYHMKLILENKRTKDKAESPIISKETVKLVKPAPVIDIRVTHLNSTCIHLSWDHSRPHNDKIFLVKYFSANEPMNVKERRVYSQQLEICELTPYRIYEIILMCRPRSGLHLTGYWSDPVSKIIQTKQDVPSSAPSMSAGSYHENSCDMWPKCRNVVIYWQPIPEKSANGIIQQYRVTRTDLETGSMETDAIMDSFQYALPRISTDNNYIVEVQGMTEAGLSPFTSRIRIPSHEKRPKFPLSFIVEIENTTTLADGTKEHILRMSWKPAEQANVVSYHVYWCQRAPTDHSCLSPLQWHIVHPDQIEISQSFQEDELKSLSFGISVETVLSSDGDILISSGIQWNQCVYHKYEVPKEPPKGFHIMPYLGENSLRVDWELFQCHESRSHVTAYVVYYCEANHGMNCTGPMRKIRVDGRYSSVTIPDLHDGLRYKIWMSAEAEMGAGPSTEAWFEEIAPAGGLSREQIIGIGVGAFFVTMLCLISIILCIRWCYRFCKKTAKPYDIVMPHVPLPPIPMPDTSPPDSPDEDSSSGIYERIDGNRKSPLSSPDASFERPLIKGKYMQYFHSLRGSTSAKDQVYGKNSVGSFSAKDGRHKGISDSGRSSMASLAEYFLSRLNPRRSSMESKSYHSTSSQQVNSPFYGMRPNNSPIVGRKALKHVPHSNSPGHTSVLYLPPVSSNFSNHAPQSLPPVTCGRTGPYSCVDLLEQKPAPTFPRHGDFAECHSLNSAYSDPAYCTNNLSGTPVKQKHSLAAQTKSADDILQQNLNITFHEQNSSYGPQGRIHGAYVCNSVSSTSSCQHSPAVPPYVKVYDVNNDDSCSVEENVLLDSPRHKSLVLVKNLGYVGEGTWGKKGVMNPMEATVTPKKLNVHVGPRPVSQIIQVPPHFYGSLSLLDSGTATEL